MGQKMNVLLATAVQPWCKDPVRLRRRVPSEVESQETGPEPAMLAYIKPALSWKRAKRNASTPQRPWPVWVWTCDTRRAMPDLCQSALALALSPVTLAQSWSICTEMEER